MCRQRRGRQLGARQVTLTEFALPALKHTFCSLAGATKPEHSQEMQYAQQLRVVRAKPALQLDEHLIVESAPRVLMDVQTVRLIQINVTLVILGTTSLDQSASSVQLIAMRVAVLSLVSKTA